MKIRPTLKPGDVVKFSKKGKQKYIGVGVVNGIIVKGVYGDGKSRDSIISCLVFYKDSDASNTISIRREHLWYTGYNANTKEKWLDSKSAVHMPIQKKITQER